MVFSTVMSELVVYEAVLVSECFAANAALKRFDVLMLALMNDQRTLMGKTC